MLTASRSKKSARQHQLRQARLCRIHHIKDSFPLYNFIQFDALGKRVALPGAAGCRRQLLAISYQHV